MAVLAMTYLAALALTAHQHAKHPEAVSTTTAVARTNKNQMQ